MPMADFLERVLIGDANQGRVELLQKIFAEEFSVEVVIAQNSDEVTKLAANFSWNVILIATSLPVPPKIGINVYFDALRVLVPKRKLACIYGEDGPPKFSGTSSRWTPLFVPAVGLGEKERRQIIGQFRQWLSWSPNWPKVELDNDRLLHEQVRSLTGSRKLGAGKVLLAQLVRGFFICDKVAVTRLGQGKSGSRVFRIRPEPCSAANPEFVLKLVDKPDEWKIRSEIAGHQKARQLLNQQFRKHITDLCQTFSPQVPLSSDLFEHVASTSGNTWQAICYGFLGGVGLGQFIDLETLLIAEAKVLSKKVSPKKPAGLPFDFAPNTIRQDRQDALKMVLEWLCRQWYSNKPRKESKLLWETPDAPPNRYSALPPYRFTGKAKERSIAFLDSFEAQLGERFPLPDASPNWDGRRALIRELLIKDNGPTNFSKLDNPLNVLLSPAHGDLNTANILLWLEQKDHHFLIDFPFYQEWGHAVQDFARLEVEMKFMLLDRQADSPASELPAFDYTPTQMALWLELEEHLLNDWKQLRPREEDWVQPGHKANVICCLELIQLIRNTAESVYRQAGAADNFPDEYWAALLYHTLRVLGYPTVAIFKRLFAVYSASSILEKLR
jgi:hypothetical protein